MALGWVVVLVVVVVLVALDRGHRTALPHQRGRRAPHPLVLQHRLGGRVALPAPLPVALVAVGLRWGLGGGLAVLGGGGRGRRQVGAGGSPGLASAGRPRWPP